MQQNIFYIAIVPTRYESLGTDPSCSLLPKIPTLKVQNSILLFTIYSLLVKPGIHTAPSPHSRFVNRHNLCRKYCITIWKHFPACQSP
jgi:hypothetical protein